MYYGGIMKSTVQDLEVTWFLQGRIIHCYDVLTVEEILERNRKILHLIKTEAKPPKVHLLFDYSSTDYGNYDADLRTIMMRIRSNEELAYIRNEVMRHPLRGWIVGVGVQNIKLQTAWNVLATMSNALRQDARTMEEAIEFLKSVDYSLPENL